MKPNAGPPNIGPDDPTPPPRLTRPLQDFIRAVTPKGAGPARELCTEFRETRQRSTLHSLILPSPPKDSAEYFVELRIREWMLRKEREEAEMRRHEQNRQKSANKNSPHPPKPPSAP